MKSKDRRREMKDEGRRSRDEKRNVAGGTRVPPKSNRFPLFLSRHLSTFDIPNDSFHVRTSSALSFPSSPFSLFLSLCLSTLPSLPFRSTSLVSLPPDPSLSRLSFSPSFRFRVSAFARASLRSGKLGLERNVPRTGLFDSGEMRTENGNWEF